MPRNFKSPIEISLPSGALTFRTFEELRDWSRAELEAWSEFKKKAGERGRSQYISVGALPSTFDSLTTWAENGVAGREPEQNEQHIRTHLAQKDRTLLLSTSPRGRYVLSLAASDPSLAGC